MAMNEFDPEEQDIVESYERDEWRSIPTVKEELQHYKTYAANTLRKNKLVGIDLSLEDFEKIQQKAVEMGISYEALIANIVHQFVAGRLVEQP